jgi:putative peptidoglycan lipid II flippase
VTRGEPVALAEPPAPHAGVQPEDASEDIASVGLAMSAGTAGRRIATAALLIMFGNVASRLLGLVRDQAIAALFGTTAAASVYSAANRVPTMIYDLLIGGAITAALVPVFTDYAARDEGRTRGDRATQYAELGELGGVVVGVALTVLLPIVLVLILLARPLMGVLGVGFAPDVQEVGIRLVRLGLVSVVLMGVSAVLMGVAYALHRVTLPAFAPAVYNLAIIVCALALGRRMGVTGLVVGMLVGAAGQVALQLPGLRGVRLRPSLALRHPGLRRILHLYAPVAAGLLVSVLVIVLDTRLASQTGASSLAAMSYATRLVQLPLGLVGTALLFGSLSVLSRLGASGAPSREFRRTVAMGLKAALLLVVPATVALMALGSPIIRLLFQHGECDQACGQVTARALFFYAPQIPFVAADQLLIAAFYALKNTRTPVLIGVVGAGIYAVIALGTVRTMGMPGLVLANTVQNSAHGVILLVLLWRLTGSLAGEGLGPAAGRVTAAGLVMAGVLILVQWAAPAPAGAVQLAGYLVIAGIVAGMSYVAALLVLRSEELVYVRQVIEGRLRRSLPAVSGGTP